MLSAPPYELLNKSSKKSLHSLTSSTSVEEFYYKSANSLSDLAFTGKTKKLLNLFVADKNLPINYRDSAGRSCLHCAIAGGHFGLAIILINKFKLPVDCRDNARCTPLMMAAKRNDFRMCNYLLAKGAKVNHHNSTGQRALDYAVSSNNKSLVLLLLEYKASVKIADDSGSTVLHRAASIGNGAITQILLQVCTNPNAMDNKKKTPLHLACEEGKWTSAIMLIQHGADLYAKDIDGLRPYDLAPNWMKLDLNRLQSSVCYC